MDVDLSAARRDFVRWFAPQVSAQIGWRLSGNFRYRETAGSIDPPGNYIAELDNGHNIRLFIMFHLYPDGTVNPRTTLGLAAWQGMEAMYCARRAGEESALEFSIYYEPLMTCAGFVELEFIYGSWSPWEPFTL